MVLIAAAITLAGAWLLAHHPLRPLHVRHRLQRRGRSAGRHRRDPATLVLVYTLTGLLAGVSGFMSLAYFGTTNISGHTTDNLDAISAVVIGGTSLFGGMGTMFGTVIGGVHSGGAEEGLRHHPRPGLLAADRGRRGAGRGGSGSTSGAGAIAIA